MATIQVGNDVVAGGTNRSSSVVALFVTGAQLTVDGKTIVEGGKLVLGTTAM